MEWWSGRGGDGDGGRPLAEQLAEKARSAQHARTNTPPPTHTYIQHTYKHTRRYLFLIAPSAVLALLTTHKYTPLEVLWTFSIFLEAVAIMPQLVLLQRTNNIDNLTGNYVALLGSYRGLYIVNWVYRFFTERHYRQWVGESVMRGGGEGKADERGAQRGGGMPNPPPTVRTSLNNTKLPLKHQPTKRPPTKRRNQTPQPNALPTKQRPPKHTKQTTQSGCAASCRPRSTPTSSTTTTARGPTTSASRCRLSVDGERRRRCGGSAVAPARRRKTTRALKSARAQLAAERESVV